MKQYTYPAVFYYDEEYDDFAVEFSDICIYAEGETMEDAYINAQQYLTYYLDCCAELGVAPNKPNTYKDMLKGHPNGRVMLVTVNYVEKSKRKNIQESETEENDLPTETFTNLNDDIVESIETNFNKDDNAIVEELMQSRINNQEENLQDDDGDGDFGLPEID